MKSNLFLKKRINSVLLIVLCGITFSLSSCNPLEALIPEIEVDVGVSLDSDTLDRVDEVNKTIREINETIGDGLGLDEETLQVVNELIKRIDDFNETGVLGEGGIEVIAGLTNVLSEGVEVGLDEATRKVALEFSSIIDRQPEKWGEEVKTLITLMGAIGTDLSTQISDDLAHLSNQVANDLSGVAQVIGIEGRCTVDHLGQEVEQTLNSAGGRFISSIIPALSDFYGINEDPKLIPSICTMQPTRLKLTWKDGNLVAEDDALLLGISGFNFSDDNLPSASIQTETGQVIESIELIPGFESTYRIFVPLQGIDFNDVPERSRIVLSWEDNSAGQSGSRDFEKIILLEDTPISRADFSAVPITGVVPFEVQFFDLSTGEPDTWFWQFGDNESSNETDPKHKYKQAGDFTVQLTVHNKFTGEPHTEVKEFLIRAVEPTATPTSTPTITPTPTYTPTPTFTPTPTITPLPVCQTRDIRHVPPNRYRWTLKEAIDGDNDLDGRTFVHVRAELFHTENIVFLQRFAEFLEVNDKGNRDGDKTRFTKGPDNTRVWAGVPSGWIIQEVITQDGKLKTEIRLQFGDDQHDAHLFSNPIGPISSVNIGADSKGNDSPHFYFDLEPITIRLKQVAGCRN